MMQMPLYLQTPCKREVAEQKSNIVSAQLLPLDTVIPPLLVLCHLGMNMTQVGLAWMHGPHVTEMQHYCCGLQSL